MQVNSYLTCIKEIRGKGAVMFIRPKFIILAAASALTLLATTAGAAQAVTSGNTQVRTAAASSSGARLAPKSAVAPAIAGSPEIVVTCGLQGDLPVVNPGAGKVTGIGYITGCAPEQPQGCSVQTDVEVFNIETQAWVIAAPGPIEHGPSCTGLRSTAHGSCEYRSVIHQFRTVTIGTVYQDGSIGTAHYYSGERGYHCY
jgi:hypothetical protein